jgi:DNA-binding transcriptional LysR family regulator
VIDKLEYLLALARAQHFGRAAEACGVTQPTLSAGIKQLEETLGVLLVHRGSRFIGLTAEGERALEWGRRIVGDTRSMRQEIGALKHGLAGRLRIAAIPPTLPIIAAMTTPYRARHPHVQFTILTRPADQIHALLNDLEIEAGVTYIDVEPLGRVTSIPLYEERYRFVTAADAPLGDRDRVTWAEVATIPLCLLTPDTVNRRFVERHLRAGGGDPQITLESDSMVVLFSHVRTGRWASVMPESALGMLGLTDAVRIIPIVEPDVSNGIGLIVPEREPMTPLTAALVAEARRFASMTDRGYPAAPRAVALQ